jgi:hypothetical protein
VTRGQRDIMRKIVLLRCAEEYGFNRVEDASCSRIARRPIVLPADVQKVRGTRVAGWSATGSDSWRETAQERTLRARQGTCAVDATRPAPKSVGPRST